MFEIEQKKIEKIIIKKLKEHGYSAPNLKWTNIPFSGKWGISTSFFQIVAQTAKQDPTINVRNEARKLADEIAYSLIMSEAFEKVE